MPTLTSGWHDSLQGPGHPARIPVCYARSPSIPLQPKAAAIWSMFTSATRSCRSRSGYCAARCGASTAPLNRVTAVVVDDLAESFVAAVTRMVLVGRGGLRLHEEVFLAGVRLKGRRAMAEEKAEAFLDQALDGDDLRLASKRVLALLCDMWNVPDAPLRARLEESMKARAARRHELGDGAAGSAARLRYAAGARYLRGVSGEPARLAGSSAFRGGRGRGDALARRSAEAAPA